MPCKLGDVMYETHACPCMVHETCMFHESCMHEGKNTCMLHLWAWEPLQYTCQFVNVRKNVAWIPFMPSMSHEACIMHESTVVASVNMNLCKKWQPMPCELGHVMYETHACSYMIHASCMFHESSMHEWKIICMLLLFAWQPLQSIYMAARQCKKNVAWTPCMPSMVHETCSCMTKKVLYVVGMSLCKHKQPMPWEFGHVMHGTHACSCMVHESCMHESKHHAAATLMDMSHCNPCQICKHKRHFKDMQMPACMKTISIFIWMTLYQYPKYSCDSKRSAIAICNSPFTNFDKKEIWTPNATLLTIFTRSLQFLCSEFGFGW